MKASTQTELNRSMKQSYILTDLFSFFLPPFSNITLGLKPKDEQTTVHGSPKRNRDKTKRKIVYPSLPL